MYKAINETNIIQKIWFHVTMLQTGEKDTYKEYVANEEHNKYFFI